LSNVSFTRPSPFFPTFGYSFSCLLFFLYKDETSLSLFVCYRPFSLAYASSDPFFDGDDPGAEVQPLFLSFFREKGFFPSLRKHNPLYHASSPSRDSESEPSFCSEVLSRVKSPHRLQDTILLSLSYFSSFLKMCSSLFLNLRRFPLFTRRTSFSPPPPRWGPPPYWEPFPAGLFFFLWEASSFCALPAHRPGSLLGRFRMLYDPLFSKWLQLIV